MKIQITMKTPCGVSDAINAEEIGKEKKDELYTLADKFFEYNEYCTIQLDTDTQTAKVIEINK